MFKPKKKRGPKQKVHVAGYCGAPTDGRTFGAHYQDRSDVLDFARRRRPFWDFEEVEFFLTHGFTGTGPENLEALKANLLSSRITNLICPAADRISGDAAEVTAFKEFARQHGITLHLVFKPKRAKS
ncbi:MAG: hypothetical protein RLZZ326_1839 [Planctomycetota bacterium]